jgi:hypothetical protein
MENSMPEAALPPPLGQKEWEKVFRDFMISRHDVDKVILATLNEDGYRGIFLSHGRYFLLRADKNGENMKCIAGTRKKDVLRMEKERLLPSASPLAS